MRRWIIIFVLAFIFMPFPGHAFDYNNWILLLPDTIAGLNKQGDPEGMNMERGGESWSVLKQQYADDAGNDIDLSIVTGPNAPGIEQFESMQQFSAETAKKKVETLEISGYKSVLNLDKTGGKSSLLIAVQDQTLVIFETASFDSEDSLISLADDVPLSEIGDAVE